MDRIEFSTVVKINKYNRAQWNFSHIELLTEVIVIRCLAYRLQEKNERRDKTKTVTVSFVEKKEIRMGVKRLVLVVLLVVVVNAVLGQALLQVKGNTCTPTSARNTSIDDVPAIRQALATCGNGGTIVIPAGEIFTIRTPLEFKDCQNCDFQIEGTLKVSDDLIYWQDKTGVFLVENTAGATLHSLTGSGLIDGSGQKFWDYFARNNSFQRPFLIYLANASDVTFTKFQWINPPFWFSFITGNSKNVLLTDLVLTAISTTKSLPKNTDGFDTGDCVNVTFSNIYVKNGDDCIAFKSGSTNVTVNNITCIGSHGISVGSLGLEPGSAHIVKNVYISDIRMINSSFGTRIKFYPSGPSHGPVFVSNVTYKDVTIDNCEYAFLVDNCYESDRDYCKKYPATAQIQDINFINITGTTSKDHDPIVAVIACPPNGTCDLKFNGWNIVSPSGNSTVRCSYYDHPSGITCTPSVFA